MESRLYWAQTGVIGDGLVSWLQPASAACLDAMTAVTPPCTLRTPVQPSQALPREARKKQPGNARVRGLDVKGQCVPAVLGEYPVYYPPRYPPTAPPPATVMTCYPPTDHRDMHFSLAEGDPRGR